MFHFTNSNHHIIGGSLGNLKRKALRALNFVYVQVVVQTLIMPPEVLDAVSANTEFLVIR